MSLSSEKIAMTAGAVHRSCNPGNPKNIVTYPSKFLILYNPNRGGYMLQGYGGRPFTREQAITFSKELERKYGSR